MLEMVHTNWRDFLSLPTLAADMGLLRQHERSGRPLGSKAFITGLEASLDRRLSPQKGGRPRKGR